jgi:hypothetical protein
MAARPPRAPRLSVTATNRTLAQLFEQLAQAARTAGRDTRLESFLRPYITEAHALAPERVPEPVRRRRTGAGDDEGPAAAEADDAFNVAERRGPGGASVYTIRRTGADGDAAAADLDVAFDAFQRDVRPTVVQLLRERLAEWRAVKCSLKIYASMERTGAEDEPQEFTFHSGSRKQDTLTMLLQSSNLETAFNNMYDTLQTRFADLEARSSGWSLVHVSRIELSVLPWRPLAAAASRWFPMPAWLQSKRCCVNVQNDDDECFKWSLLAAIMTDPARAEAFGVPLIKTHCNRVSNYIAYQDVLDFTGLVYPVSLDQLPAFEEANPINVDVWALDVEAEGPEARQPWLEYRSTAPSSADRHHITLLRAIKGPADGAEAHYVYLKSLPALVATTSDSKVCQRCLQRFSSADALAAHAAKGRCALPADGPIDLLPPVGSTVEFRDTSSLTPHAVRVFAAFTTAEGPDRELHVNGVFVRILADCELPGLVERRLSFDGAGCVAQFLAFASELQAKAFKAVMRHRAIGCMKITRAQQDAYWHATACYLCKKPLARGRVRDHCHTTGAYLGPACARCNLNRRFRGGYKLPVLVHELGRTAGHFLVLTAAAAGAPIDGLITGETSNTIRSMDIGPVRFRDLSSFVDAGCLDDAVARFEAARDAGLREYGVEMCHFVSLPGYAWASLLRHTGARLELLHDGQQDLYSLIRRSIRGGPCVVAKRHAVVAPSHSIKYYDVNSLYGFVMTQPLPVGGFAWAPADSPLLDAGRLLAQNFGGSTGAFLEVDAHVPAGLHDSFAELPPLPERVCAAGAAGGAGEDRLLLTLEPKKNYLVHGLHLQYLVRQGLVVTKVHKAIVFDQAPVFKSFVELNATKKATATSPEERSFFKLLSNACFGKTIADNSKHRTVKLVSSSVPQSKIDKYISKPTLSSADLIGPPDASVLQLSFIKASVKRQEPVAVGFAILELAKLHMQRLWRSIKAAAPEIQLLYHDTDSLIVEGPDTAMEVIQSKAGLFSQTQSGLLKNEYPCAVIQEFVALAPKTYSLLLGDDSEAQRAAGVHVPPRHAAYRQALFTGHSASFAMEQQATSGHVVSRRTVEHAGLRADAAIGRHVLPDGINTLPFGHFRAAD